MSLSKESLDSEEDEREYYQRKAFGSGIYSERVDWTQAELRELGLNYLRKHPDMFPAVDIGRMSGDGEWWADGPIIAVGLVLQVRM
eukprot:CAMPEP_0170074352 /NCGR_PEP_ID=MMETSP0019_2-20121128/11660_1 /TAXON_ID=98059 /ORGANISM="Dinobryon sp., Strain UTEXLB2267" /LENGTH=85 /DNA_ID=CAMNT_0010284577 /DNA_START=212 /DNA_END=470 /DNA_ORIENTATION=+